MDFGDFRSFTDIMDGTPMLAAIFCQFSRFLTIIVAILGGGFEDFPVVILEMKKFGNI